MTRSGTSHISHPIPQFQTLSCIMLVGFSCCGFHFHNLVPHFRLFFHHLNHVIKHDTVISRHIDHMIHRTLHFCRVFHHPIISGFAIIFWPMMFLQLSFFIMAFIISILYGWWLINDSIISKRYVSFFSNWSTGYFGFAARKQDYNNKNKCCSN